MRKGIYCIKLPCAGLATRVKRTNWGKFPNFQNQNRHRASSKFVTRQAASASLLAQASSEFSSQARIRSAILCASEAIKPETKHTMTIQITSKESINGAVYFTAICGKTEAFVGVHPSIISAACINAANKRTKRSKGFRNFEAAIAHYKSAAMQAILSTIREEVAA